MITGIYRGIVYKSKDDKGLGRLQVYVPSLGKNWVKWAMPNSPFVGKNQGLYMKPKEKSLVWIGFEEGDENKPIWLGGFWGIPVGAGKYADEAGIETPETDENKRVIKTEKATIEIDDTTGNVTITTEGEVNINNGSNGVARKADAVKTSIPINSVIVSVTGGSGAPAVGILNAVPIECTGEITESSETVKAGD